MAGSGHENAQWLSVTEETLFLHDGLMRVTDLVELPHDVNTGDHSGSEVVSFESKSPAELCERLLAVCRTQNNAYTRLLEYRLNALRAFWHAHHQTAIDEQQDKENTSQEETVALLKKQGLLREADQASFSTRVSILLVLPLLQSQSKIDPALSGATAELLLNCLRDCTPLSLSKEPSDCLNGLENLLCSWLGEKDPTGRKNVSVIQDREQRENAASSLIALACARGHLKTFIHTIHLLQSMPQLGPLPVADILHKLLEMEGGPGQPITLMGGKHIVCWSMEDMLTRPEKDATAAAATRGSQSDRPPEQDAPVELDIGRSLTTDGIFLYTTNGTGRGAAKLGTGLHGTPRGYLYTKNADLTTGWLAWGDGILLHRPIDYDRENDIISMAQILDPCTLKPTGILLKPEAYISQETRTSLKLCSDGVYFYWFWTPGLPTDKSTKGQPLYMDVFRVDAKEKICIPLRSTVVMLRKDESANKSLNETLLSRLRPYRSAATAATLVALTGSEPTPAKKDESNTSCGLPLKTLLKTPIFCDGTTVVLLTAVPGGSTSGPTRSLFGSGTGLSTFRSLASNMCFSAGDGHFITKSDLIDAPTCALARGAPLLGLGVCYDVANNLLWTCSADWVDQYFNPGHQARHHILRRMAIDPLLVLILPEDNMESTASVTKIILQHVGSMCLHQLNSDLLQTPLGSLILQQQAVDLAYMERGCDILERAIKESDCQVIVCTLIILQLIFKVSSFKGEREREEDHLQRTKRLVWTVLNQYSAATEKDTESLAVQKEVCQVLCVGLNVLYREPSNRKRLLHQLLTDVDPSPGLARLQRMVFVDLSERLRNQWTEAEEIKQLRLPEDLVQLVLKRTVRESCSLLRSCQTRNRQEFDQILASVPIASPSLQYLMALQSSLLREAVLYQQPEGATEKPKDKKLQEVQLGVLCFASKVFNGAFEVLEVLLETCNMLINNGYEDPEYRLQGLERVCKATILGHLVPLLVTAMTHYNLRCLAIADTIMPQLVQLVVLTSQAALLLKSQVQAIQEDLLDISTDTDIVELIAESLNLDRLETEEKEEGFLAGLKIPAPWATGRTVESIHPVRDNYKFKETVQIPGARCLYLRFDPRCSSQYDYDKLIIYAGPNTGAKKVAEYGGNTFGYGSRSVLGSGWPKDLVKVEGDTVTFSFEMRSGREHNTPDKAMWGFSVTVRAQESAEEVSNGLPFLADLALGLSVLACTMLHLLYNGPDKTQDETACEDLLKAKLLQRCVWQVDGGSMISPLQTPSPVDIALADEGDHEPRIPPLSPSELPRIRLPVEIVNKLREMSDKHLPTIRPSIKKVIQPGVLEESILSASIKHLSLSDVVRNLPEHEEHSTEEYFLLNNVVSEVYSKLGALIRQLQALAELEQKWSAEVEEIRSGSMQLNEAFFMDYHLMEDKDKELAILCFLKDVHVENDSMDKAVGVLREKMNIEAQSDKETPEPPSMAKTRIIVDGLIERLNLLLHVTMAPEGGMSRSISIQPTESQKQMPTLMVRSDTVLHKPVYGRSMSAPSEMQAAQDDSIIDIMKLQKKRQAHRKAPAILLQDLVTNESRDKPPHVILLDQLFTFIGSNPEKAVSCKSFLAAAQTRWKRGATRQQALKHMKELLTAASKVGGATHLVAAVTSVLQHGPRTEELTCGGMVEQVREAFIETMTSVVKLAARYHIACCNSIGLLCTIPYTRAEEKCLVHSGLVHLLDRLCSLSSYRMESTGSDAQTTKQKVSAMAWAGFQVLANRCVTWEQEDSTTVEELEHSGLARQVSILLTNHLARATECSGNEAAGSEALQEVLSLLNNLSRSRMGKAILSQPGCVSKLLSLLLDQRPSPKLVLIILQLCRVALPLMSASDCDKVELPVWGQEMQADYSQDSIMHAEKPVKIASLLLAKLGDFLVPGEVTTISSRRPSMDHLHGLSGGHGGDKEKGDDKDVQDGRLSIFIHKRADQSSHEVIQPLLSSDSRPFRLSGGTNMERVVRMDREMTKTGKAEITTEDAVSALRRAAKWAQMGLVVSTGPPAQETSTETNSGDKKKTTAEMVCKDKNAELSRTDPVRPFISGHVASSMAAEVIGLLHSLLTAPETHTAQLWASAVEQVISEALSCLPTMLHTMDDLSSVRGDHHRTMALAKQADAALAALGGFEEAVRPGCEVQITGPGVENCMGTVLTVSEQTGLASVALLPPTTEDYTPARYKDTVQVPLSRLRPPSSEPLPLHELSVSGTIVSAVQSLLLPQISGGSPLTQQLPVHGDGNSLPNQICRVVAEIRTRACRVLASHLRDLGFASAFIQHSSASIDILKSLAKDCEAGDRENVIAAQCQRLRLLYRDCAKPPPPPSKLPDRMTKEITFDTTRTFPPTRSCLFSHGLTAVTFLGDPSIGSGLPRGTIVYATQAVPNQAPSFYWELEISSFGDQSDEGGPTISFGFMPAAEKKDGAWTYPVGTCLFHNNGRAVHYNGSSLLQWRSLRLDVTLNSGDVAGIGWERQGDTPPLPGQPVTGCVYFTHNGRRLPRTMDNVAGSMWPVVHIQKRNTSIRGNFGSRPFTYAEGQHHRNAADECSDLTQEIKENFGVLPFNLGSDSDSEGPTSVSTSTTDTGSRDLKSPPGPPCKTVTHPKALRAYNPETSLQYRRQPCYENFTQTGPSGRSQTTQEDESDLDEGEEDQSTEDHYALLVKAWEQKVFPTIRRRFRNEAERKDGLEQIKGALQLGMTDIARQTVEFLYEENGGIPRDLHLPTIDDIKEELAKFTIERVRKGTTVVIRQPQGAGQAGTMVVPKFAVRPMLKTFGRTGIVLDIDQPNELVQVETYLRSEGVLVRYWYPLDMLEKPPQGYRKASSVISQTVLDTSNVHIHRELLRVEAILARMHCRSALLELISQCNSPAMEITNSANLSSAMAASAAVLQELDLENLQLLSNELLASPQPHGGVVATSLMSAVSPAQCLSSSQCSAVNVFYNEPDRLKEELKVAIARAANQGEDYLIELSNQICMCLQTAPEMFPYEEMRVTESKVETDLHFPDAAFLIVSCRIDPGATRKDTSLYKAPWARIFTYRGHRVKRSGHATKQEVVCYPRDTSSISTQSSQFAPVIIPADLVHVKIGVAPPPGYVVTIHAVPLQFPLAVAYIETLATVGYGFQYRHPDADLEAVLEVPPCETHNDDYDLSVAPWRNFRSVQVTPTVLLQITELLCGFLWRTHLPAMMKESLFHLLAQTLRLLRKADAGISSLFPTLRQQPSTSLSLLTQLQAELQKLYEEETKGWPTATTASGTGMGLGVSDQGRFSTYFHSLLEVCLASSEVTSPGTTFVLGSPLAAASDTSSPGLPASMPAPTSPVGGGKRKKLKTKRERDSTSRAPRRSTSPRRLSEGDASPSTSGTSIHSSSSGSSVSGSSATLLGGTKTDDMLWFQRAVTMSQILRNLGQNDSLGEEVTNDAISDAFKTTCTPSAYSRLLVLTGLPPKLDKISAVQAIKKACNACGGLFKDEVFIPTQQTSTAGSAESKSPSDSVKSIDTSTEGQSDGESTTRRLAEALADESETSPRPGKSGSPPRAPQEPFLKGYAVLQLRSKCKVDVAKNLLLKNRLLVSGSAFETEELVEVPYDVLSISMVNQNLFAEEENGNEAIEAYLMDKLISNKESYELCDSAMIALTEIFHSCFINEQRVSPTERPESGYICLNWDQICSPATGNLLFTFLSSLKPPKRSVNDHIGQVLKKYGMPKLADKDESDRSDKSRPTRKASKPSKEKLVCGATAKPSSKDKKPRPKDIGEKGWREENEPSAKSSKEPPKESDRVLTLDGFLSFVVDHVKQDVKGIWRALLSTGFDFHFDRCACLDVSQAQQMALQWTPDMDVALVHYVNKVCRHLAISPSRLHPHELYLTDEDLSSMDYKDLQGVPCESLCLRFALLQSINTTMETFFLPLVDLRPVNSAVLSCSTAALLSQARGLVFYDTKVVLLNRILNTTALRKPDQAAPEVTLDPLEYVGGERRNPADTNFCQALRQLSNVPSSQLCVRIAAGGDPTYAFNVRMLGEEVHGTSGSFRHFLGHVSHELQSGEMSLLIPCATSATNRNRGKYLLRPGPMTYAEEQLLIFLGQLLGITLRADIPLGLDLLPLFWKNLVGVDLDPVSDLQDADLLTYNYVKKFEMAESEDDMHLLVGDSAPKFTYPTLTGEEVELIPNGRSITVSWENRQLYLDSIRSLRMDELHCKERTDVLRAGMASIMPPQFLYLLTPMDAQVRLSGIPEVNLDFLKAHTMYQVGLMDTDTHIEYFWNALETFSQEDLAKFIKFACNQERIPMTCPCQDGGPDTSHVPPYPMKIAPPDGSGSPDSRYIRVETCMFMVKLPQYSSQEVMTRRLMYAINCREDPLSG